MTALLKPSGSGRGVALLAVGALGGALLAAVGIVERAPRRDVPVGAVALVNGSSILRADYERAAAALIEATKKEGPGAIDESRVDELKRRALDRLIEEELLVQRGIELALPERDPQIRATLSARVLEMTATPGGDEAPPDDGALRDLFEREGGRFQSSARRRVAVIFFSAPPGADPGREAEAKRRSIEARARIDAGEKFDDVRQSGDPLVAAPPDALLPVAKLYDYLGATATRAVLELKQGEVTAPLRGIDGYRVLSLVEVGGGDKPDFNEVRGEVLAEYRRRQEDSRVRGMLDRRKAESDIVVAPLQ